MPTKQLAHLGYFKIRNINLFIQSFGKRKHALLEFKSFILYTKIIPRGYIINSII